MFVKPVKIVHVVWHKNLNRMNMHQLDKMSNRLVEAYVLRRELNVQEQFISFSVIWVMLFDVSVVLHVVYLHSNQVNV